MLFNLKKKSHMLLWQGLFLLLGTSWLWASHLNPHLSYRSSLISQYETLHQPYSWLFRACDLLAGVLLLMAAGYYIRVARFKTVGTILVVLSFGLMLDPLLSTSCRNVGNVCDEYFSFNFVLHATETIITAAVFFVAGAYDVQRRRKVVSVAFVLFQIAYGCLFLTQWADQDHFNTVSQFIYQTTLIAWLAWFVRDYLEQPDESPEWELPGITELVAGWAFLNGIFAILLSLSHLDLLGKLRGVYFTSDNAWLAQHGMIIGVIMLYLARHLARGERRARQIFLLIIGIEVIKYSVIAPSAVLLILYSATFVGLFLARDSFNRGSVPLTWQLRLKDLVFLLCGLLTAAGIALLALDRDNRVSVITARSVDHLSDYITNNPHFIGSRLSSVLLAHSISAFILAAALAILWVLFKPNNFKPHNIGHGHSKNYTLIKQNLERFSKSSEDYFKYWPNDKDYFWGKESKGFVAYKIVGSTAFGLADPIGSNTTGLVNEFNQWCNVRRLKVCFLPVYPDSLSLYKNAKLEAIQIGSSAKININKFLDSTSKDKWWRWKLNQAKKAGYIYINSTPPHSTELLNHLKSVSDKWLAFGGHAEHSFAMGYFDKHYMNQCKIHYLTDSQGQVICFTNELPQFKDLPVATIDLLRYDPETKSPMPLLIYSFLTNIAEEKPQIKVFDLGFVPFAKARGPLLKIAKSISTERFSSRGLEQFKDKFNPDWEPNYMAYGGDLADLAVIALSIEKVMEY